MRGLRTRPRTDVDPPRFLDTRTDADGLIGGETICQRRAVVGEGHKGLINAFLSRMYKYHFVSDCFAIDSILDDMDRKFFKLLFSQAHCLHSVLPPVKSNP